MQALRAATLLVSEESFVFVLNLGQWFLLLLLFLWLCFKNIHFSLFYSFSCTGS